MTDKKDTREITFKDITKLNIQIWDAEREIQSLKKLIVTSRPWVDKYWSFSSPTMDEFKAIQQWIKDTKDIK